jgi:hypothetical protein
LFNVSEWTIKQLHLFDSSFRGDLPISDDSR